MMLEALENRIWDVVIAGGGLAGLTLARQLKMEFDDMEILVVEKVARPLPDGCHKVGESSVELGSNYLETLGLRDYLRENHIIKHGLRFFPGGGKLPLEDRYEIGPAQEPIVPSYQMDRGRLETDLREMVIDQGITLVEGATVREPELGTDGANHTAIVRTGHGDARVEARWLLDATGRTALLRKKMKLSRGTRHPACSGWFRIAGKFDINDMVPEPTASVGTTWSSRRTAGARRTTSWATATGSWVIPLSTGMTSIGLVVHDDTALIRQRAVAGPRVGVPRGARARHFAAAIADREKLDFLCLKGYSHNVTRPWSADRWGMVGEAGAFVDPLYSPGTDFIAFANCFTTELIRTEREGGDLQTEGPRTQPAVPRARARKHRRLPHLLARLRTPVGDADEDLLGQLRLLVLPCQYYFQKIYKLTGSEHSAFTTAGQRFVALSNYMQSLYREWALAKPEEPRGEFAGMPAFPSVLVDAHLALEKPMTPAETLEYVTDRAEVGEQIAAEMVVRVLWALGDDAARKVAAETGLAKWDLKVDPHRIDIGRTIGLARRRAMTPIGRDLERTLGRPVLETSDEVMRELLAPLFTQARDRSDPRSVSFQPPPMGPDARFMQLLAGKWVTSAVSTAAQLGVGDALTTPKSPRELAAELDCHLPSLERLLRVLAAEDLLSEDENGRFELTETGRFLRSDELGELAHFVGASFMWDPWTHLHQAVRDGKAAFEHATGDGLFEYLQKHDADAELYHRAVDAFTRREARALAREYDFSDVRNLADIGGGLGTLVFELLDHWKHLRGTLFDRPHVIEQARERLSTSRFSDRVDLVAGDFMEAVPEGRDAYVVKHVIHNWPDDTAARILRNCAEAMAEGGKVLVVEGILLPGNRKDGTRLLDLEMMVLCGEGRERTKREFKELFRAAGLKLERTLPLADTTRLLIGSRR